MMEELAYAGYVMTSRQRAEATDVALTVNANDFNFDDPRADYDLTLTDGFEAMFAPTKTEHSLSGLWSALHPHAAVGEVEYR